ncbi:MAG: glycosyltransferase family 2 protein [Thomasclavelia sp.]
MISIIIPYNVEQYLDKCLQSVIHQTYQDIEIILVDDGSSDNSVNSL